MSVTGRRLNLRMSKQLADHGQPFTDLKTTRSEGMSQVMNTNIIEQGFRTYPPPWMLKIGQVLFLLLADNHIGIVIDAP
ncbi:hypothetical protein ACMYR2_1170 [Nitrobacter sp. TKz-YC01]